VRICLQRGELLLERGPQLCERVEARVDLLLGHRRARAHELLERLHLRQQHPRQLLDVRAALLEAATERLEVGDVLAAVDELLLQSPRLAPRRRRLVLVRDHVDVLLAERLQALHVLAHLPDQRRRQLGRRARHVRDARAALANVPVEEPDAEDDVGELLQLRRLVLGRERGEGLEADPREDALERRRDLALRWAVSARLVPRAHDELRGQERAEQTRQRRSVSLE